MPHWPRPLAGPARGWHAGPVVASAASALSRLAMPMPRGSAKVSRSWPRAIPNAPPAFAHDPPHSSSVPLPASPRTMSPVPRSTRPPAPAISTPRVRSPAAPSVRRCAAPKAVWPFANSASMARAKPRSKPAPSRSISARCSRNPADRPSLLRSRRRLLTTRPRAEGRPPGRARSPPGIAAHRCECSPARRHPCDRSRRPLARAAPARLCADARSC